ncbi:MAG TPA: NUMOD4 domain-containing protein [Candidatus Pelethenecus sp.]|nr:NUMOD4 domain-containing protein [Candidatus Pelethenecus sp.]
MKEVWKDTVGYEGLYLVSNLGKVYSLRRNKVYKEFIEKNGYNRISVIKNGVRKKELVHRLVAKTFIPNPQGKLCVNHKDNNRSNNKVDNLEWVTQKENIQHAVAQKRFKGRFIIGESNPLSKLTVSDVLQIRKSKLTQKKLASLFNVSQTTISDIKIRDTWKHV